MTRSLLLLAGLLLSCGFADAQKKKNSAAEYGSIVLPANGHVRANFRDKAIAPEAVAKNLNRMLGLSAVNSFRKVADAKDNLGFTHADYQQYYSNVKVEGGQILVHSKDGLVTSINGIVAPLGTLSVTPSITTQEAAVIARKASLLNSLIKEYPAELVIAGISAGENKTYALAWKVRVDGQDNDSKFVMVNVFVDALSGKILNIIDLIAHGDVPGTGNTVYSGTRPLTVDNYGPGFRLRDSARKVETYNGNGQTVVQPGVVSANVDYTNNSPNYDLFKMFTSTKLLTVSDSMATLIDPSNILASMLYKGVLPNVEAASALHIVNYFTLSNMPAVSGGYYNFLDTAQVYTGSFVVYDAGAQQFSPHKATYTFNNISLGTHSWADTMGNTGTYTISMQKNPAVDAHWGMQKTKDFYQNVFSRNSFDGLGSVIKNYVDMGLSSNAQALPSPYNFLVYGLGDGANYGPFVALDIMAHEFTHLVTENNGHGGLAYTGESGALNESFSDIFGASIEFYAKSSGANWTIGEGVRLYAPGYLRSMSDPKLTQNPDTYEGQYWVNPISGPDNGGVHTNSGVQNKWYYLLTEGGSGTNDKGNTYAVTGVGMAKAQQIVYRNLTNYLTAQSGYMDAYDGSLQATLDLHGNDTTTAEYLAVKEAWYAVGIGEKPTTAINEITVKDSDLKLYPNPATGRVTISSALNEKLQAQIVNVVGIPVMNITVTKGLNPVDISGLAKGVYMIRYNTGAKGYVQKLSVL